MNISAAGKMASLSAKTIRYYEEIGLILPARASNGYRDYDARDISRLTFVQRSRSLGFSIDECRTLLSLYDDRDRASADVKFMAREKIADIDAKLTELQSLRDTLSLLVANCHGDQRPDCPIIDQLAGRARDA